MIALIRVRFTNTPAQNVWSDAVMHNWMNPTIEFSLGHFWTRTSLFQADMRYFLFPVVVMDDPRPNKPADKNERDYLVDEVIKKVTADSSPDWNVFSRLLICFAQATDQFGGGSYKVPLQDGDKYIPAAVVDNFSPFSNICQELGHTFGLDHEFDGKVTDYTSPYSVMSSESYGGAQSSFQRPVNAALPVGNPPKPLATGVFTNDVQRVIGPYITPAQFVLKNMGMFSQGKTVYFVPGSYATAPHNFRLMAYDKAIDLWPTRFTVVGVLPPLVENGDIYFVELRRNKSYDANLSANGSTIGPPVAVVIHAGNLSTGRMRYINAIPLAAAPGDFDYHCFEGKFTVRLTGFEEDYSACNVTVGGDDFWKYFAVNFEQVLVNESPRGESEWNRAFVSPCFMFPKAYYAYRYCYITSEVVIVASSFGYEKPGYQWYINDQLLDPAQTYIAMNMQVKAPEDGQWSVPQTQEVVITYQINANKLTLKIYANYSGIYITVKAVVNETSTNVVQSLYPDRSIWTGMTLNNVDIEWEQAYNDAQNACGRKVAEINKHYSISEIAVKPNPDPEPGWGIAVKVINELLEANPAAANAVINEVAKLQNVSKVDVIKRLR
jgi:hypothetical protein